MNKLLLVGLAGISFLFWSCGESKSNNQTGPGKKPAVAKKAEMPKDFTLAADWSAEYKGQKFVMNFNGQDMTGTITFSGAAEPVKFKWEEERPSSNRINVMIYAKKSSQFAEKALAMKNQGLGFSLKMSWLGENKFKVYNGLYLKEGKVARDDGPMEFKREAE